MKKLIRILLSPILLCALLLCSCDLKEMSEREYIGLTVYTAATDRLNPPSDPIEAPAVTPEMLCEAAAGAPDYMDETFFDWCGAFYGDVLWKLLDAFADGYRDIWYELFGMTEKVVRTLYLSGVRSGDEIVAMCGDSRVMSLTKEGDVRLAFGGDVCLADDWENMVLYYEREGDLARCLSDGLLNRMNTADFTFINNEFCYSERGEPLSEKYYTFRANPANTALLIKMGVDGVSLANNHIYDYGYDAFCDTLDTLDSADIMRVGAGRTLEEAMKPLYVIVGGYKVAIVAASRAEKMLLTPAATDKTAGVLRTYKPVLFLNAISDAAANADYVIAYPHWGTENTAELESAQTEQAKQYIDAGADAVIGSHPHCLQGIEIYNGCPILYSLGNFWFNYEKGDTMLAEIVINDSGLSCRVIPCTQDNAYTADVSGTDEGRRILGYLESISKGIAFDDTGKVCSK